MVCNQLALGAFIAGEPLVKACPGPVCAEAIERMMQIQARPAGDAVAVSVSGRSGGVARPGTLRARGGVSGVTPRKRRVAGLGAGRRAGRTSSPAGGLGRAGDTVTRRRAPCPDHAAYLPRRRATFSAGTARAQAARAARAPGTRGGAQAGERGSVGPGSAAADRTPAEAAAGVAAGVVDCHCRRPRGIHRGGQ